MLAAKMPGAMPKLRAAAAEAEKATLQNAVTASVQGKATNGKPAGISAPAISLALPCRSANLLSNFIRDRFVGRLFRLGISLRREMKPSSRTRRPAGSGFLKIGADRHLTENAKRLVVGYCTILPLSRGYPDPRAGRAAKNAARVFDGSDGVGTFPRAHDCWLHASSSTLNSELNHSSP